MCTIFDENIKDMFKEDKGEIFSLFFSKYQKPQLFRLYMLTPVLISKILN